MPDASTQTVSFECVSGIHRIQSSIANSTRSIGTQTESDNDLTITLIDDNRRTSGSMVLRSGLEIVYVSDSEGNEDDSTVSIISEESNQLDQVVFDSDLDSGYHSDYDPLRAIRNLVGRPLNYDDFYNYLMDG